jgi:hypothetical protein
VERRNLRGRIELILAGLNTCKVSDQKDANISPSRATPSIFRTSAQSSGTCS